MFQRCGVFGDASSIGSRPPIFNFAIELPPEPKLKMDALDAILDAVEDSIDVGNVLLIFYDCISQYVSTLFPNTEWYSKLT